MKRHPGTIGKMSSHTCPKVCRTFKSKGLHKEQCFGAKEFRLRESGRSGDCLGAITLCDRCESDRSSFWAMFTGGTIEQGSSREPPSSEQSRKCFQDVLCHPSGNYKGCMAKATNTPWNRTCGGASIESSAAEV